MTDKLYLAHMTAKGQGFVKVSDYLVKCLHCGKDYDVRQGLRITRHWLDHRTAQRQRKEG